MLARRGFSKTRKGQHREPRRNPSGTRRKAEHAGLLSRRRPLPKDAEASAAPRAGPRPRLAARSQARRARAADTPGAGRSAEAGPGARKRARARKEKPRCNPSSTPHETAKEGQSPSKREKARKGIPPAGLRRVRRIPRVSSRAGPRAKRKAPSASATPCPPAALRCSTLGEGGLNCRVRDGTG